MSEIINFGSWVSRKSNKDYGATLVHLQHRFVAGDLTNAADGTAWANGEHVGLFEIPFGSTVLSAVVNLSAAAGGTCTASLGVLGFTAVSGTAISDGGSTGASTTGLIASINLNSATSQAGTGVFIGRKLDELVFTDADELNKPLYVTMEALNLTTSAALCAGVINLIISVP